MKKGPFKLRSGNGPLKFKNMGSSPVRHPDPISEATGLPISHSHPNDYEEHYGTYTEYKADSEAAGVEPLDIETWVDLNAANMPSGKKSKKGYNPKKTVWQGRRVAEREKIDPEYAEALRKVREEGLPDDLIESLDRKGVDAKILTDE